MAHLQPYNTTFKIFLAHDENLNCVDLNLAGVDVVIWAACFFNSRCSSMSIGTTNVEVLTMEYSMRIEWHVCITKLSLK